MIIKSTDSDNLARQKTSNMQSAILSNRVFLGIVAFSVSFGLSLVPNWDFSKAFFTGIITLIATYAAAFCVDKRRKKSEMFVLGSLHKRIKELEGLKSRIVREVTQIEEHRSLLYAESQQLQNQVAECRKQRDILHRDLGNFAGQKKQLESEISSLKTEFNSLEKNQSDLNNSLSMLTAEKRRLELNFNSSRAEINQLQTQICELLQEKHDIESNLTLLARIKPQIEEKMYELRMQLQDLEMEVTQQNKLLRNTTDERENLESLLKSLQNQVVEQKAELEQLQGQISLLQEERDLLQSQVWELLQQIETFNPESAPDHEQDDELELFPFSELLDSLETTDSQAEISANLPEEWTNFLEQLPGYEIQVLKAIVEQENPKAVIKQIAEANITMPNLLIDSINERANHSLGELIINPGAETPEIYDEHKTNLRKMMDLYQDLMTRQTSSN
jgi:chromosome segregation ATPase